MANNVQLNVYQIGTRVLPRDQSQRIGFPAAGIMIQDCSASPQRSLSSGYNVYGFITANFITAGGVNQQPLAYYVQETFAQLATLIG